MASQDSVLKSYKLSKSVITQFTFRRSWKAALVWGLVFGGYVVSKADGFAKAYPTVAEKHQLAAQLGNNVGFRMLLGPANNIYTVAGFTVWNCLSLVAIIAAIWGIMASTKLFRGEEEAGRTELLLSGRTTMTSNTVNTLLGLGISYLLLLVLFGLIIMSVGKTASINFAPSAALFFSLAASLSALLFISIGAMTSQIMPTRARSSLLATAIFGVFFILRAIADSSNSLRWMLNFTPFGWIEKSAPLYKTNAIWIIPILILTLVIGATAVLLARKRDLGESYVADKPYSKARTAMLNSPMSFAIRMTRNSNIIWLAAVVLSGFVYGLLTKAATNLLNISNKNLGHDFSKITNGADSKVALIYMGVIFLILMVILMIYSANAVSAVRQDEASGYLDNLLVEPVGRLQWLWGRVLILTCVILLACLLAGLGSYFGAALVHSGVPFSDVMKAGLNLFSPAFIIVGFSILVYGIFPRLTSLAAYALIAWSFLLALFSQGLHLNHWILDLSVLHQTNLAPAVNPDWKSTTVIILISVAMAIVGSLLFKYRDLQTE